MNGNIHGILLVASVAGVTALLRFIPFWLFGGGKETPQVISYLGRALPYAIMGMLVVYCLREISFLQSPYGLPQLLAVGMVTLLHCWKRNTLLSILGGTVLYMILIQAVF